MTDPRPAISVIIPCAGDLPRLHTQLDALERQRDAPPFEVLVVDNGAGSVLDEFRHRRLRVPCGLRLVDGTQRRGSSYARNVGAHRAGSDLLMFCDADDVVSASWVRHGARAFDLAPVWTGAAISVHDAEFRAGATAIQARIDDVADDERQPVPDTAERPTVLMGGNFGIQRDLYLALGGFDVSVPHHGDDNDLAVRIRSAGEQIPRFECVRIGYRHHPGMLPTCRRAYFASRAAELLRTRTTARVSALRAWTRVVALVVRAAGFPVGMLARRRWHTASLVVRWCHTLGTLDGVFRYAILRRTPPRELGVGLLPSNGAQGSTR